MPNPSLVRREKGLGRHTVHQLLHVDLIRFAVACARFLWFTKVRGAVDTLGTSDQIATNTISHNLKGLRDLAVNRSMYLTRPLSVIDTLKTDADVLVVGPRTEGEILGLIAHGFERRHIRGLDLITYSPWVELGDMHAMPFADDSFDLVMLGWVLAYSEDRDQAAKEVVRVLRPGGIVAVGVEWAPESNDELIEQLGYLPGAANRIHSCSDVLGHFGAAVKDVLVREDPDRERVSPIVAIFSVQKEAF